jgi:hypothetical protein
VVVDRTASAEDPRDGEATPRPPAAVGAPPRQGGTVSDPTAKVCLVCARSEQETPLVELHSRGQRLYICPQHLPVLIHDPGRLVGRLPGAEALRPADHHD